MVVTFALSLLVLCMGYAPVFAYDSKYDCWHKQSDWSHKMYGTWDNCKYVDRCEDRRGNYSWYNDYVYEEEETGCKPGYWDMELKVYNAWIYQSLTAHNLIVYVKGNDTSRYGYTVYFFSWQYNTTVWARLTDLLPFMMGDNRTYRGGMFTYNGTVYDLTLFFKARVHAGGESISYYANWGFRNIANGTYYSKYATSDYEAAQLNFTGENFRYYHGAEFEDYRANCGQQQEMFYNISASLDVGHAFDIDGDWDCDIYDIIAVSGSYGYEYESDAQWYWNHYFWKFDIVTNLKIDIYDVVTIAAQQGLW